LLFSALPSLAEDFYEVRLKAGQAELEAGHAAEAADDLRIAAFGFLGRPPQLCTALANLALAQQASGQAAAADATMVRLIEVDRVAPSCRQAGIDPRRRAELEALVRRRLTPAAATQLLAVLGASAAAAPPTGGPATAAAPPTRAPAAAPVPTPTPAAPPAPTATRAAPPPTPTSSAPAASPTAPPAASPTAAPPAARPATPRRGPSDDLDRQPQLKLSTRPVYPPEAQRDRIGGVVLLSVLVSERGDPAEIEVSRGVRPDLDQAAVSAVRRWTFEPGRKGGAPVAAWMTVAVPFDPSRR
jgi:protein TonB